MMLDAVGSQAPDHDNLLRISTRFASTLAVLPNLMVPQLKLLMHLSESL